MKKNIILLIALVLLLGIGSYLMSNIGFSSGSEPINTEKQGKTFFMVHLEVGASNSPWYKDVAQGATVTNLKYQKGLWPSLIELVNLANEYSFKLTIAMTPQWAEYILQDSRKVNLVKNWQGEGHEIAFHHHGFDHPDWDGYSNRNTPDVTGDHRYRGKVQEGFKFLKELAFPQEVTVGTVTDFRYDMPEEIEILTRGGGAYGNSIEEDAVSDIEKIRFKNQDRDIIRISHALLQTLSTKQEILDLLKELESFYLKAGEGKIFGVVAHAHDFNRRPEVYRSWFDFIRNQKDSIQTISKIVSKEFEGESVSGDIDSPFGLHPGSANNYEYIKDMGIKWSREGTYAFWELADKNKDGSFDFNGFETGKKPINYDKQWSEAPVDINIVANICPYTPQTETNAGGSGLIMSKNDEKIYGDFVNAVVERYDGDKDYGCKLSKPDCYKTGDGQYPSPEVISAFELNPIKFWQVCNQVEKYADFAEIQKISYLAAKKANPEISVIIAGDSHMKHYPEIFKDLNGNYIDIVDFHRFGAENDYNPEEHLNYLKKSLEESNFNITELKFWITETGTYSGQPRAQGNANKLIPYQTEADQATGLIKRYVSALSLGVEKVFWAWNIVEGFKRNCGIFDYTGLIYDGCDCDNSGRYVCKEGIGNDLGKNVKKLGYYSYKLMVDKLDGGDFRNIETVYNNKGVYVYKLIKNGKPIWIAWNDNPNAKTVSLGAIGIHGSAMATEAVPDYESGKEATAAGYPEMFKTYTVSDSLILENVPVFIEE